MLYGTIDYTKGHHPGSTDPSQESFKSEEFSQLVSEEVRNTKTETLDLSNSHFFPFYHGYLMFSSDIEIP